MIDGGDHALTRTGPAAFGPGASPARWVVCAGAREYLGIAAALVQAGVAGAIEWEPSAPRACARVGQLGMLGPVNAVVGDGLAWPSPIDVACALAGVSGGATILCTSAAHEAARPAGLRGVTATVTPAGLVGLLGNLGYPFVPPQAQPRPMPAQAVGNDWLPANAIDARLEPIMRMDLDEPAGRSAKVAADDEMDAYVAAYEERVLRDQGPGEAVMRQLDEAIERARTCGAPVTHVPIVDLPQCDAPLRGEFEHVPTICFLSARGGVGKSALAAMTALALAREGYAVALIDLDYQFGTCLAYLGCSQVDGLIDPDEDPLRARVDAQTIARCRTTPERRLAAYRFCSSPEQTELLTGLTSRLIGAARTGVDVAVIDLPTGVNEVVAQALDQADRVLMVADQRAYSLESLSAQQSLCSRLGIERTRLITVMNRCDPRHRDEGFLSRVQFESQAPRVMRVVDGGDQVTQLLSVGGAGELLAMRNKFALSAADLAHAACVDLGCQPSETPGAYPPGCGVSAGQGCAPRVKRKHRRDESQEAPCPF